MCVCVSVIRHILPLLDTFYQCSEMSIFFVTSVFLDSSNSCTVGNENVLLFLLLGGWKGLYWVGWSVCNCREDEYIFSSPCS